MKTKILSALLCLAFIATSVIPAHAAKFTFRNQPWGVSKESVFDNETNAPKDSHDEYLAYEATLFGYDFDAVYVFKKDKLFMGKYVFTTEYKEKEFNEYIIAYNNLKDQLAQKYGKPKKDKTEWHDSRLEFDKNQWGLAVALGHVLRYATWEKNRTEINIHLAGMNGNIHLQIQYRDMRVGTKSEDMI